MSGSERSLQDLLSDARERRGKDVPETDMARSEYNNIIMLCHQFRQAFTESYQGSMGKGQPQPFMERRRNRIFQTIALLAKTRKELPSIEDYFGDRQIGIFNNTIAEMEALEYVGVIHDKIMEMNDWRVSIGTVDDDLEEE